MTQFEPITRKQKSWTCRACTFSPLPLALHIQEGREGPCWNYEDGRHTRRTASQQCGILIKLQNHYTNPRWLIFGFLLLWKEQTVILVKPLWLLAFCYLWSDVGRGTHILPAICISQYVWCFMCSWFNFKSSTTSITFVVTKYQQFCIYPEWVPFVVVVDKMSW